MAVFHPNAEFGGDHGPVPVTAQGPAQGQLRLTQTVGIRRIIQIDSPVQSGTNRIHELPLLDDTPAVAPIG